MEELDQLLGLFGKDTKQQAVDIEDEPSDSDLDSYYDSSEYEEEVRAGMVEARAVGHTQLLFVCVVDVKMLTCASGISTHLQPLTHPA
jgi:hypothetical protein